MSRPVVLVVEDDAPIRRGLVDALHYAGYDVRECGDGAEGLALGIATDLDLALLDVMLPGMNGMDLLEQLRVSKPGLPVIMVTARGAEEDRIRGLKTGADDYVVKPFSARELLARVEAVLRRTSLAPRSATVLKWEGVSVNLETRQVQCAENGSRSLSEKEAEILAYLAGTRGRAVAREELLQQVWGLDPRGLETRTVDMHVARLRDKLGDRNAQQPIIMTVRSKGYMLVESVIVESR